MEKGLENKDWKRGKGRGFYAEREGKLEKWILCCPECGLENYAMAVATGKCAWCGHKEEETQEQKAE